MSVARALVAVCLVAVLAGAADARSWAWLGVRIRDLSEQEMEQIARRHGIKEGFGVLIVEVIDDTPAARSGLRPGDIVVAFEQRPVVETRMLQRLIAAAPTDAETALTVLRTDGRQPVSVRLVAMPPAVAGERVAAELGFVLRTGGGLPTGPAGARGDPADAPPTVAVVAEGSPAERGGLEVGDVVLEVNAHAVATAETAREALAGAPAEQPLRLTVRRGAARLEVAVGPP